MPSTKSPRKGSLQYWPRKRARKFLPSVNWNSIPSSAKNLKGFIAYKAGMLSASAIDNTPNSMTKGKKVILPVTIIECPPMKIYSVRFYKNNQPAKDVLAGNFDKELKRKLKAPKNKKEASIENKDYDDVTIIAYSDVKKTGVKKTPDLNEIGLSGTIDEKLSFIKENLGKEFSAADIFEKGQIVDIRGLTKGKGFQGPVKRFGIRLRQHKSEKGVRRPGSIGPWHPARVTFRVPMAGQLGMFTRIIYNNKVIDSVKAGEKELKGIKNYGDVKNDYIIVQGSVQGPSKRQLLITAPLRETKRQSKKQYDLEELR